eukprot:237352_1
MSSRSPPRYGGFDFNLHLNTLLSMDWDERCVIPNYYKEARDYKIPNSLEWRTWEHPRLTIRNIENKCMELLQDVLNNGYVPFDVAFCRLLIILDHLQFLGARVIVEFIPFVLYFVLGSCFPSIRNNIATNGSYQTSKLVRYLVDVFFANFDDQRCMEYKYTETDAISMNAISSVLNQYIIGLGAIQTGSNCKGSQWAIQETLIKH